MPKTIYSTSNNTIKTVDLLFVKKKMMVQKIIDILNHNI